MCKLWGLRVWWGNRRWRERCSHAIRGSMCNKSARFREKPWIAGATPIPQSSKCLLRNSNQDTQQSDSCHACCQAPKDAGKTTEQRRSSRLPAGRSMLCTPRWPPSRANRNNSVTSGQAVSLPEALSVRGDQIRQCHCDPGGPAYSRCPAGPQETPEYSGRAWWTMRQNSAPGFGIVGGAMT